MSLYHWGSAYPWRENEIPEAGKFHLQLRREYNGLNGDDRAVADFYETYGVTHGKPIAIPETAAMYNTYNTETDEADELVMKQAWWQQVVSETTFAEFPQVKMINWFEVRKQETEIQNAVVNWAVTLDAESLLAFRRDLSADNAFQIRQTYLPAIVDSGE